VDYKDKGVDPHVKIGDFGLSEIKPMNEHHIQDQFTARGTPLWMAPEVLLLEPFNEKSDVYSFGINIWSVINNGIEPFPEFKQLEPFVQAICYRRHRPPIRKGSNPLLVQLMNSCWDHEADKRPDFGVICRALDHIIVETAVTDPEGAQMWKECFLPRTSVEIGELVDVLAAQMGIENQTPVSECLNLGRESGLPRELFLAFRCLKAILLPPTHHEHTTEVKLENFGAILAWFPSPRNGNLFLKNLLEIMASAWFHGDIDGEEAVDRLAGKPEGTFLVRFSSEPPNFTVSKVSQLEILHQRIYNYGGRFSINEHEYHSLQSLVTAEAIGLGLNTPCLGSRFQSLFSTIPSGYISGTVRK